MDRVLITGAGGFIGSHLVEHCVAEGLAVRAFVHYNAEGRRGWIDGLDCAREIEVLAGDIRDYDAVSRAVRGCRRIFHLAALIGIPYSYSSPLAYIRTNVEGTYNVLEAARNENVEQVLITSTSEVYGTARRVPMDESHPLNAQSPYAATKTAADQLALSFHRSFGLDVRIVRPFNTYGPRQSARAVIPSIIVQLLAGRERLELGNLHCTRDFTFVRDTAAGFLAVAAAPGLTGEVCHIGSGREISVAALAGRIASLIGVEAKIVSSAERVRVATSEVERLLCDNTRIREKTRWAPRLTLDDGLRETIEWIRPRLSLYRPDSYGI